MQRINCKKMKFFLLCSILETVCKKSKTLRLNHNPDIYNIYIYPDLLCYGLASFLGNIFP